MPPRAKKLETPLLEEQPPQRLGTDKDKDAEKFSVAAVPEIVEYTTLAGEVWRVGLFPAFVAEFDFSGWAQQQGSWERALTLFHEAAGGYGRGWLMARQLFGISPLILSATAHPDDSRIFTRKELYERHGIEGEQLTAELSALRTITKLAQAATPDPLPSSGIEGKEKELALDDELLRRHGFPESMFKLKIYVSAKDGERDRSPEENKLERDWFVARVREWDKMLSEPFAHSTVRDALYTDLYLHRLAIEMAPLSTGSPRFKELSAMKKEFEQSYRTLRETLQGWFPAMNIAGRDSQQVTFSDIHKGYRAYKANGDTALLDQVRTALEMEVECQQSLQQPEPAYRFGHTVYIVEARNNLYDPTWRSQIPLRVLRALDQGFKNGVEQARQESGKPLVDMEKGIMRGEGDDFPELGEK